MLVATVICALTTGAYSHSLAVCTDFADDMQSCAGYARNINTYFTRGDGVVLTPPSRQLYNPCDEAFKTKDADAYQQFPMASANAGETLTVTWPSNNHQGGVAAEGIAPSNNPRSPDDVYIYMTNQAQPTSSLLLETPMAKLPYSNCFAQNKYKNQIEGPQSRAKLVLPSNAFLCKGDYTIPAGTPAGTYTFVWAWKLGGLGNYTSCWDVQVGGNTGGNTGGGTDGPTGTSGGGCVGGFGQYSACSASCGQGTKTRTYTTTSGNCPFANGQTQSVPCETTPCASSGTAGCNNDQGGACYPVPFRDKTCFQSGAINYCWTGRRNAAGAYYVKRCSQNSCPLPNIDARLSMGADGNPEEAEDAQLLDFTSPDGSPPATVGGGVSGAATASPLAGLVAALALLAVAARQ